MPFLATETRTCARCERDYLAVLFSRPNGPNKQRTVATSCPDCGAGAAEIRDGGSAADPGESLSA